MKLYKDDLDIAARRAVKFRDEEQQKELVGVIPQHNYI